VVSAKLHAAVHPALLNGFPPCIGEDVIDLLGSTTVVRVPGVAMNVTSLKPRAIDTKVVANAKIKQTFVVIIRYSSSEGANHRAIHRSVRSRDCTEITQTQDEITPMGQRHCLVEPGVKLILLKFSWS